MISITRLALDIQDQESQLSFSVKQGDISRRLIITLVDNRNPFVLDTDCYAVFAATKSDGTKFNDSCVIQNGKIIYDLDAQLTVATGKATCDITLYHTGGEQLSTAHFVMNVFESVFAGMATETVSTDKYLALNTLVGNAADAVSNMNTLNGAVTTAEAARVAAESDRADENAGIVAQASGSASSAADSASAASASEANAASSASAALNSASAAADSAAHAAAAAGGGVITFNGRYGAVAPQSGDYTANMVGADAAGTAAGAVEAHNTASNPHTGKFAALSHTHAAAEVNESESKRFVSDTEKSTWNSKATSGDVQSAITAAGSGNTAGMNTINVTSANFSNYIANIAIPCKRFLLFPTASVSSSEITSSYEYEYSYFAICDLNTHTITAIYNKNDTDPTGRDSYCNMISGTSNVELSYQYPQSSCSRGASLDMELTDNGIKLTIGGSFKSTASVTAVLKYMQI